MIVSRSWFHLGELANGRVTVGRLPGIAKSELPTPARRCFDEQDRVTVPTVAKKSHGRGGGVHSDRSPPTGPRCLTHQTNAVFACATTTEDFNVHTGSRNPPHSALHTVLPLSHQEKCLDRKTITSHPRTAYPAPRMACTQVLT